ncbi:hypothetical protein ACM66B_006876 [Microbotryomycetes sp. NB124-2]
MAMALASAWSGSPVETEEPWTTMKRNAHHSTYPSEGLQVAWDTDSLHTTAYTHFTNVTEPAYQSQYCLPPVPYSYDHDTEPRSAARQFMLPATPMTDHGEWVPYYDASGESDAMYGVMEEDLFAYAPVPYPPADLAGSSSSSFSSKRPVTADASVPTYGQYQDTAMFDSHPMAMSPAPYEPAQHQVRRVVSHGHVNAAPAPVAANDMGLGLGIVMPQSTYWQDELSSRRFQQENPHHRPFSHATSSSSSSRSSTFVLPRQGSSTSSMSVTPPPTVMLPKNVHPVVRMNSVPKVSRALTFGESMPPRSHSMAPPPREPISVRRHQRQAQTNVLKTFTLPASPVSNSSSPVPPRASAFSGEKFARRRSSGHGSVSVSAPATPTISLPTGRQSYFMDVDPRAEQPLPTQMRIPQTPTDSAPMPPLREETPSDSCSSSMSVDYSRVSTPSRRHSEGDSSAPATLFKAPLKFVFEPLTFDLKSPRTLRASACASEDDAIEVLSDQADKNDASKGSVRKKADSDDDDEEFAPSTKKLRKQLTKRQSQTKTSSSSSSSSKLPPPPALTDSPTAGPVEVEAPTVEADDTRSWSCSFEGCTKKFKRLEHLVRHGRSHTQEKPFSCDVCSRAFTRNDNMMAHRKTHASDRIKRPVTP